MDVSEHGRPKPYKGIGLRIVIIGAWLAYNWIMIGGCMMAAPILAALAVTSKKRRKTFQQRLGWWTYGWECRRNKRHRPTIWVHALSVGEVVAAEPLVQRLVRERVGARIVFTTSTYTGFQTAKRILGEKKLDLAYFPYDLLWSVHRAANKIAPSAVILVETDLWPNFLMEMKRRRVPVSIVNLRLSPKSWQHIHRLRFLVKAVLGTIAKICTQTQVDADRLIQLGVPVQRIAVTGNLKFDCPLPKMEAETVSSWRRNLEIQDLQRVVVAGSTHEGEEEMLLQALEKNLKGSPAARLIIAPRDPGRAHDIVRLCRDRQITSVTLSHLDHKRGGKSARVVVVDAIGYLKSFYGLADIAFVGGSLVRQGGHNPLEPAAFGKPVIFGPDMKDFEHIAAMLLEEGAARQVGDVGELESAFSTLLGDPQTCERMGQCARSVLLARQGAVRRTLASLSLPN